MYIVAHITMFRSSIHPSNSFTFISSAPGPRPLLLLTACVRRRSCIWHFWTLRARHMLFPRLSAHMLNVLYEQQHMYAGDAKAIHNLRTQTHPRSSSGQTRKQIELVYKVNHLLNERPYKSNCEEYIVPCIIYRAVFCTQEGLWCVCAVGSVPNIRYYFSKWIYMGMSDVWRLKARHTTSEWKWMKEIEARQKLWCYTIHWTSDDDDDERAWRGERRWW